MHRSPWLLPVATLACSPGEFVEKDTGHEDYGTISCEIEELLWVSDWIEAAADTGAALTATAHSHDGSSVTFVVQPHQGEATYQVSNDQAHAIKYVGGQAADSSDTYSAGWSSMSGVDPNGIIVVEAMWEDGMSGYFQGTLYTLTGETLVLTNCIFDLVFTA